MKDIKKLYPNDYNLGEFVRANRNFINITIEEIKAYPNDADLGNYIRNTWKQLK